MALGEDCCPRTTPDQQRPGTQATARAAGTPPAQYRKLVGQTGQLVTPCEIRLRRSRDLQGSPS